MPWFLDLGLSRHLEQAQGPICNEGAVMYTSTSTCCCNYDDPDHPASLSILQVSMCVNGAWVGQGSVCDGMSCPGLCPL